MSKIKIKYFGPIKEGAGNTSWIEIKKTTIFIGNQGSGKSTVAKLIALFTWIEKVLVRGDYEKKKFETNKTFVSSLFKYHRLDKYFDDDKTQIEYVGLAFKLQYKGGYIKIKGVAETNYALPQIMYVPAERNFISYVRTPKELKLAADSLKEFLTEFENAKQNIKGEIELPINDAKLSYDKANDILNVSDNEHKVWLTNASSGFQSLVPLFLVSSFLAKSVSIQGQKEAMTAEERQRFKQEFQKIWTSKSLSEEQKQIAISTLSSKFNKAAFVNIVEEPEQNLFPNSQWEILKSLLAFNNSTKANKLIITTHSPYIINYLTISIQAWELKNKIEGGKNNYLSKLEEIIPLEATINSEEIVIYQLNEKEGTVKKLENYEGIPSDNNFLNNSLEKGNDLFDALLEIEQGL